MANPSSQPTIPVKKSDGTTVKMTLDEFQAYKKSLAQQSQPGNAGQPADASDTTPEKDKPVFDLSQSQDTVFDGNPDEKNLQIEKETEEKKAIENSEIQELPENLEEKEKTELIDAPQTELLDEVSSTASKEEPAQKSEHNRVQELAPKQEKGEFEAMFEQLKEKPGEDDEQKEQQNTERVEEVRKLLNNDASKEEGETEQEQEEKVIESPQTASLPEEDLIQEQSEEESEQHEVTPKVEEKQPPVAATSSPTWQKEDHASLLEDADDVEGKHAPVSSDAEGVVGQIMTDISFLVPDDLQGRLLSLLVSRVKQVRNNDQVLEYATKSTDTGGLGMDDTQAQALIAAVSEYVHDDLQTPSTVPPRRAKSISTVPKFSQQEIEVKQSNDGASLPQQQVPSFPAAPEAPTAPAPVSPSQPPLQQTTQTSSQTQKPAPVRMPKKMPLPVQQPPGKAMMHDVTPPAPKHSGLVGPVDEFHKFTLDDFRRLAADSRGATERLRDKMEVLQNESYMLFEQARKAWFESPLFNQYHDMLVQSLNSRQTIRQVVEAQSQEGLSEADMQALASFHQFLS